MGTCPAASVSNRPNLLCEDVFLRRGRSAASGCPDTGVVVGLSRPSLSSLHASFRVDVVFGRAAFADSQSQTSVRSYERPSVPIHQAQTLPVKSNKGCTSACIQWWLWMFASHTVDIDCGCLTAGMSQTNRMFAGCSRDHINRELVSSRSSSINTRLQTHPLAISVNLSPPTNRQS